MFTLNLMVIFQSTNMNTYILFVFGLSKMGGLGYLTKTSKAQKIANVGHSEHQTSIFGTSIIRNLIIDWVGQSRENLSCTQMQGA